jgi:hypothetical protein
MVEIPKQQAVNYPPITLRQIAEKKLKLIPAPSAGRVPLSAAGIHFSRGSKFAILDLPAERFRFFGDHAGADAVSGLEAAKESPLRHVFSFVVSAEFSRRAMLDGSRPKDEERFCYSVCQRCGNGASYIEKIDLVYDRSWARSIKRASFRRDVDPEIPRKLSISRSLE